MDKKLIIIIILITLGMFLPTVFSSTVTFKVYQDSGNDYNLTGVNIDCNGTTYDINNQTSPFTRNFTDGNYSCTFSKSQWDSNTVTVVADTNKTQTIYLDKFVYPKIYAFYATTASTSSTTAVPVQTWSYDANFGGTTSATVSCVLWASVGPVSGNATWTIQSSDNGSTWTTRGTATRSMTSNNVAANPFIETTAYNISDGTRYFRLTHSYTQSSGTLTTNNVSCHLRTNRDQNNFLITAQNNARAETTVNSSTYTNLGAAFTMTSPFNGFLYTVGSTIYRKSSSTSSETSFRALNNAVALAEYPRYVANNYQGTGGIAELLKNVNSGQVITTQYQGKSTSSSVRLTVTTQNFFLNQKVGEFEQTPLTGIISTARDWNKIACATFTKSVKRDIEVVTVIPFSSSASTNLFEIYINFKGTDYDVNSTIMKRDTTVANQNVIIKHQYLFKDVNATTVEGCIYGRSTTGTIRINGGNVFGITTNTTTPIAVTDLNSTIIISDMNLFESGDATHNVDLTTYSDLDIYFDFNAEGNAIDVNSGKVFYRPPFNDQNCFGVERATIQCGWKQEEEPNFFNSILTDTNKYVFTSETDDDHAYKPYVYNDEPDFFKTVDGNFAVYGNNRWVKTLHTLVPIGPNYFYNFSFSANPPTGAYNLEIYDCNNDTLDPTTDTGCFLVDIGYNTPKDPDTFYSIRYNVNDQNKILGHISTNLNADGNHWTYLRCPSCTVTDNWSVNYVARNTNIDRARNWTTTVGSSIFTAVATTHNLHYHYLNPAQSNYAEWYVTLDNLAGTTYTSSIYRELISTANLPPLPDGFNSPLAGSYYKGTIDINWNVYDSSDSLKCDFNITDSDSNVVYSTTNISATNGNTLCVVSGINISGFASGTYTIHGTAREYNTDFNYSGTSTGYFNVDNTVPVTTYSGCDTSWNNAGKTITLNCADTNGSGCSSTQYRINSGSWTSYSTPFPINTDGNNQVDYNSTDATGNTETTKTAYCAIDTNAPRVTAPTITVKTADYNSGTQMYIKGPINVSADINDLVSGISVSDINQSACQYSVNAGSTWSDVNYNSGTNNCYIENVELINAQEYIFRFRGKDNTNNTGTGISTVSYIADSVAPVSSDNAPTEVISGNNTIIISSVDSLSDVNGIYYCEDEADTCDPSTGTFIQNDLKSIVVSCSDITGFCTKYIRYLAIDNIGNTEEIKSTGAINFDNSVPDVGDTDINEFTIFSSYIKGTGNIIGGVISGSDFNTETSGYTLNGIDYNDCGNDCYDVSAGSIRGYGITIENENIYSFNTRIGKYIDGTLFYGYGIPTRTYTGDLTAPVTSDNYDDEWSGSDVTVILSTVETGSGIKNTNFCIDTNDECTPEATRATATVTCAVDTVCQKYLRYNSIDNLDNAESDKSVLVKIDKEKPNTTIDFSETGWVKTAQTITFTCDDNSASGCATKQYKLDNSPTWITGNSVVISTDANHLLEYRSIDAVGNIEDTNSVYVAIDVTAPTFNIDNNNVWFNAPFNLLFTDVNFEVAGFESVKARINLGSWIDMNNSGSTYYVAITTDGNNRVDYNIMDASFEAVTGTTYALLDSVEPTTTASGCESGWYNSPQTIDFNCVDALSGCTHTYLEINGDENWFDSNTVTISLDGNTTINYYSTDLAGNAELENEMYCAVDESSPFIDSIVNAGVTLYADFNVEFKAINFGASGFASAMYKLNNGSWTAMSTTNNSDFNVLITMDGNNTIGYNFTNNSGNSTAGTVYTTKKNLNAPIVIYDLNLFILTDATQNVDLTNNSDILVYFDFNADGTAINLNSSTIFYRPPIDDLNCFGTIRATKQCTWKQEASSFVTGTLVDTNRYVFTSEFENDQAYLPWAYNDDPNLFKTNDGNFAVYGNNRWIKTLYTLVPKGPNYFYNVSFHANAPTGAYDLEYYDCNNDSLDPTTDAGCFFVSVAHDTPKDLDTFYSIKSELNDQNQIISRNLINVNVDGNHWIYMRCPSCTVTDHWSINYIARNTNIDRVRNWTTTIGSFLFTTTTNTHNLHFHYLDTSKENYAEWYVTLNNEAGTTYTSEVYRELISSVNNPPIPDGFNSPISGNYYTDTIDINWNVYDSNDNLKCDFNIIDSNDNSVYSVTNISATNGNTLCIDSDVDISEFPSGTYTIKAITREYNTDFNFSRGSNTTFNVDHNYPVTSYSGCNGSWYNYFKTITLSCADTNGSGCSSTQYRINSGSWTSYSTPFTLNADGNNQVDYNSIDNVGNIETTKTAFCAIDTNAPRVTVPTITVKAADYNSGTQMYIKGPINISADINDLVSGITVSDINSSACEYSINGGSTWLSADYNSTSKKCYKNSVTLTNSQEYIFRFRGKDNTNNTGTGSSTVSYIADSAAPVSTENSPNGTVSGNISVTITSNDSLSDVNGIYYCVGNTNDCNSLAGTFIQDNTTTISVGCGGPDTCTKYLRYLAIDNIGNIETEKSSGAITFNNAVPKVEATDINEFTIFGSYIKGTGNIIGGIVTDIDFNSETKGYTINGTDYIDCNSSANCTFTDTNQIIVSGITTTSGNFYSFNTRIGHTIDGNYGYGISTITYKADLTAPITTNNCDGSWHNYDFTVIFSTEEIGSGVRNTSYCNDAIDGCTPDNNGTTVEVTCAANSTCKEYINYYSVDNLNNTESTNSLLVKIDKEKPVTTIDFEDTNWTNTTQTINFDCNDNSGSGCTITEYKINNAADWTENDSVTISTDGNYFLEYRSIDAIGNTENTKSVYVAIDKTAPTFSRLDNNGVWLNAPFNLISEDVNFEISGKSSAQVKVGTEDWKDINVSGTTYYTQITTDGNNKVDFNLTDLASNSLTGTVYGLLDTVSPVTTSSGCDEGWNGTTPTIDLNCEDVSSGCNHTYYQLPDDNDWTEANTFDILTDGNTIFSYYSIDIAGNIELVNENYCAIDSTSPVIGSLVNIDTIIDTDFNVEFLDVDFGISGIESATYRLNNGSWETMLTDDNINFYVPITLIGDNKVDYSFINQAGNYTTATTHGLRDTDADITPAEITLETTVISRQATINLTSDEDVNCRIDIQDTDFDNMEESTEETGTEISWIFDNLSNGIKNYYIVCKDTADNLSTDNVTFTIDYTESHGGSNITTDDDSDLSDDNYTITVKKVTEASEGLILTRITELIPSGKEGVFKTSARYSVSVYNPTKNAIKEIYITEIIPKEIAKDVSDINFTIAPDKIINADPVVQWFIPVILPGQTIDFNYTINSIEDTNLINNPNQFFIDTKMTTATVNVPIIEEKKDDEIKDIEKIKSPTFEEIIYSKSDDSIKWYWYVLIAILVCGIVFFIIKKRKKHNQRHSRK